MQKAFLVLKVSTNNRLVYPGTKQMAASRRNVSMKAGEFNIKPTETEKPLDGHIHQSLQWNHHLSDHKEGK